MSTLLIKDPLASARGALLVACAGALLSATPLRGQTFVPPAASSDALGGAGLAATRSELPDAPAPGPEILRAATASSEFQEQEAAPAGEHGAGTGSPSRTRVPQQKQTEPGFPPVSPRAVARPSDEPRQDPEVPSAPPSCLQNISTDVPPHLSCAEDVDPFQRFIDSAYIHPLTPKQKGLLAFRNTVDPFNFATIAFVSAVSTASDPQSAYGPGLPGFGRNFGVAYAETATGEFFGTFLIPAIAHQDPHYYRMPNASITRRIFHAISQVGIGVSDYGTPMPNYSILLTTAIGDALGDLYVPGRKQGFGPFLARYSTAIGTDPINNFITEFLPDVARRVNVRIVLIQRVINQVSKSNGGAGVE